MTSEASSGFEGDTPASDDANQTDVLGTCVEKARGIAKDLNHCEVTFAHLLLATTQEPQACEKLRARAVDIAGVRRAAILALAEIGEGPDAFRRDSDDLTDIHNRAQALARDRAQRHQSPQLPSVEDLLDAVLTPGVYQSAQQLLAGRLPVSPLVEIRDTLRSWDARFGQMGQTSLELTKYIYQRDEDFFPRLRGQLTDMCSTLAARGPSFEQIARISATSENIAQLPAAIDEIKYLVAVQDRQSSQRHDTEGRSRGLFHSTMAGAIGLALLLAGYALGSSGVGPKLVSWLGQFIA